MIYITSDFRLTEQKAKAPTCFFSVKFVKLQTQHTACTRCCLSYLYAARRYLTDLILSRSFWFGAKLMRKPSPSFLLRLEGDAASVTAEIGTLGRADLRWSRRQHGPSQVKCSSWTGSPCGGATSRLHVTPRSFRRARLVRANRSWARAIVARVNMRWAADAGTHARQQARAAEVPRSLLLPFLTVAPSPGPLLVQVRDVKTKHMWNKQTQANEGKQNNGLSCSCSGKGGRIKRSPEVSIRCPEPRTILSNVPLLFCAHV